jgi:hypothetical protein
MKIMILNGDLGASKAASELELNKIIVTGNEKRYNCNKWNLDNFNKPLHKYISIDPQFIDSTEIDTDILFTKTTPSNYRLNTALKTFINYNKPKYVALITSTKCRNKLYNYFDELFSDYHSDYYKLNTASFGLPIYDQVELLLFTRSDLQPVVVDDNLEIIFTPMSTIMHSYVPMKYLSPHQDYFIYPTNTHDGIKRIAVIKDKNGKIRSHNRHNRVYDPDFMGVGIRSDCHGCSATGIYLTEMGVRRLTHIEAAACVGLSDIDMKGGDDFRIKFIADSTPYPIAKHILKALIENYSLCDKL